MLERQQVRNYLVANLMFVSAGCLGVLYWGDQGFLCLVQDFPGAKQGRSVVRLFSDFALYAFYLFFTMVFVRSYARSERPRLRILQGYLLAELIGSLVIVRSLKMLLGRARPDANLGDAFYGFSWDPKFHAFPSGHTVDIWICAFFAGVLFPHRIFGAAVIAVAVLVSLSRIAMDVHWPTDVIAGAVVGALVSMLVRRYWLASPVS